VFCCHIPIVFQVGGVTPQQLAVYEEFGRNIPGFLPTGGATSSDAQHPTFFKQLPPQQQPQQPQATQVSRGVISLI
jgi:hypothetical protein